MSSALSPFPQKFKDKFDSERNLDNEMFICANCYKWLAKYEPQKDLPVSQSQPIDLRDDASCSSSSSFLSAEDTNIQDDVDVLEEANASLGALSLSPMKMGKLRMTNCFMSKI